jgi:class 3 adenylate cyclase
MYSKLIQDKIFERYAVKAHSEPILEVVSDKSHQADAKNESIDGNHVFREYEKRIKNSVADAYVAFVDIYQFSSKIKDKSIEEVQAYLEEYYGNIIPIIKEYGGQIDKIIGDGIVVVFSDAFNLNYINGVGKSCLDFCKKCVERLNGEKYAVKAAIGSGKLFFAKTIVEKAYEEYSCIGHPMTVAFRLENEAKKNQVLIFEDDPVNANECCDFKWTFDSADFILKGIDSVNTRIYEYNAKQQKVAENMSFLEHLFGKG